MTDLTLKSPSELLIPRRTCICGCGRTFQTRNKTQLFICGDDSKLKSLLRKVARGEISPSQIPQAVLDNRDKVKFLRTDGEMAGAIAKALALK